MNGNYLIRYRINSAFLLVALIFISVTKVQAQQDSVMNLTPVQMIGRPSADSVVLRWAPLSPEYWAAANTNGYRLERYTLVRDGKTLSQPEQKTLGEKILPYEESGWESVINQNKFVIIAAQALLGETFDLNIEQSGPFEIANKVKETEQRYSIALFCADMSVTAAQALGLYYIDRTVIKGERYLYRIMINDTDWKGSVFVNTEDKYDLPAPIEFSVTVNGNVALLKWDQSYHKRLYTAYVVERSEDSIHFQPLSEDPLVTLSPQLDETKYQYATDTIPYSSREFYYRIRGISPFGETGPPSEVQTAKAKKVITTIPNITSATSLDNKTIHITWDYPDELNASIEGFYLERAGSHNGNYQSTSTELLVSNTRTYMDPAPGEKNYYRVAAITLDKERLVSFPYYMALVDSVPPVAPVELTGKIDRLGNVTVSWTPNTEEDIYGYRVYRSYYLSEEFVQITSEPIKETQIQDRVELKALNEKIHYRVMAIDRNQNHSTLSDILSLQIPDQVPPVTPVFLPVKSDTDGVELQWLRSSSDDVVRYDVYRKGEKDQWIRMGMVNVKGDSLREYPDSIYNYVDNTLKNGEKRYYTITAIDDNDLESPPSPAVLGTRIKRSVWPAVPLERPVVDRATSTVLLRWSYGHDAIRAFQIYRAVNDEPMILYKSVQEKEFRDRLIPGGKYVYKVMAVHQDGSKTEMGSGVSFTF